MPKNVNFFQMLTRNNERPIFDLTKTKKFSFIFWYFEACMSLTREELDQEVRIERIVFIKSDYSKLNREFWSKNTMPMSKEI